LFTFLKPHFKKINNYSKKYPFIYLKDKPIIIFLYSLPLLFIFIPLQPKTYPCKFITKITQSMKYSKTLLALMLFISIAVSCNKDPDPCEGVKPFKATFQILEPLGKDSLIEVDTATINKRITFKAPKGYDSYKWLVDDKEFTNIYLEKDPTQFFLTFPSVYDTNYFYNAKITLIATKKPTLNCLPKDDGVDTISKNLHVKYWYKAPIIFGKYFGYYGKNTKDTATVQIGLTTYTPTTNLRIIVISNINKGSNLKLSRDGHFSEYDENGWRWINAGAYYNGSGYYRKDIMFYSPNLTAILSPNHQDIVINFSWTDRNQPLASGYKRVFDTFTGKRIK
jgi:hypothetical protein